MEQVYYSIDTHPEMCANALVDLIRADRRSKFEQDKEQLVNDPTFQEIVDNLGKAVQEKLDEMIGDVLFG